MCTLKRLTRYPHKQRGVVDIAYHYGDNVLSRKPVEGNAFRCVAVADYKVQYDKIDWRRCFRPESVYERHLGIGFGQCLQTCRKRPYCKAVNYWSTRVMCEIVDDDGPAVNIGDVPCASILREDIQVVGNPPTDDSCFPCTEYRVCDEDQICTIKGCPKLVVSDAKVYGNIRSVGSRAKIVCLYGAATGPNTTQAVCQQNGEWLYMSDQACLKYCEQLPPIKLHSSQAHTSVGRDAIVDITCDAGYVIKLSGVKTNQVTQTAYCDDTTKSWTGLDVECVLGMTLRLGSSPANHATAKADCETTGHLLRIDSGLTAKMPHIQAFIDASTISWWSHLWVDGESEVDNQWFFSNGVQMLTSTNLWYQTCCKSCLALRTDYRLHDQTCSNYFYYICEIV